MLTQTAPTDQFALAFAVCKEQAAADGYFSDSLLRHWFGASWNLCAEMVGLVYPPRDVSEGVVIRPDGAFSLSYTPSSEVKLYQGATLIMVLPPSLERSRCDPSLCCYCSLTAQYRVGDDTCVIEPRFVQAVARLFTYICENRGDVELDREVLANCGALSFLGPDLTYVM